MILVKLFHFLDNNSSHPLPCSLHFASVETVSFLVSKVL